MKGNSTAKKHRLIMCILLQLRHCHYSNYLGATTTTPTTTEITMFNFINLLIDLI